MKDKRDAEVAIRKLDNLEFGFKRRRLRVEWAKRTEADRKREVQPSTTLFVVNFDLGRVRERDLEKFFSPYGELKRVEIRKNYAFVEYETIEEAKRAIEKTDGRQLDGRTISVEYTQNDDPQRAAVRGGRSRSRSPRRDRSPSYDRGARRSPPRGRDRDERRGGRSRSRSRSYSR